MGHMPSKNVFIKNTHIIHDRHRLRVKSTLKKVCQTYRCVIYELFIMDDMCVVYVKKWNDNLLQLVAYKIIFELVFA